MTTSNASSSGSDSGSSSGSDSGSGSGSTSKSELGLGNSNYAAAAAGADFKSEYPAYGVTDNVADTETFSAATSAGLVATAAASTESKYAGLYSAFKQTEPPIALLPTKPVYSAFAGDDGTATAGVPATTAGAAVYGIATGDGDGTGAVESVTKALYTTDAITAITATAGTMETAGGFGTDLDSSAAAAATAAPTDAPTSSIGDLESTDNERSNLRGAGMSRRSSNGHQTDLKLASRHDRLSSKYGRKEDEALSTKTKATKLSSKLPKLSTELPKLSTELPKQLTELPKQSTEFPTTTKLATKPTTMVIPESPTNAPTPTPTRTSRETRRRNRKSRRKRRGLLASYCLICCLLLSAYSILILCSFILC
jgi:hypothetical protein